jgi:carbonic anhydrase
MLKDNPVNRLVLVTDSEDIFPTYRDTPIGRLVEYHDLARPHYSFLKAELVIGMCMGNRKHLHIPDNFAFIIRAGGANLR